MPTSSPARTRRPPPTSVRSALPLVGPGVPAVLGFEPSTHRRYTASVLAPPGWLITSIRDVRGRRELEHMTVPARTFEGTMRPGPLVVEVTPWPGAGPGSLFTWFTDRRGVLLPGSGGHPLP